MSSKNSFKMAMLAASIALAMGSTAVMAATAPTALQLPGAGTVKAGSASPGTITTGAQIITISGNTVINWGAAGGTINATSQPAGFNIGSGASLTFSGAANTDNVLNVDVSGNPSQIFGTLAMSNTGGNLYVANTNGIIVGATGKISGPGEIGLIANTRGTVAFGGTASANSIEYQGDGGDVSVAKSATLNGTTVLVSGGGVVNVDLSTFKTGAATIQAGVKNSTSTLVNDNTAAVLTATGDFAGPATLASFASAGNASSSGTLNLGSNARVDGTLTNTGAMDLGTGFAIKGGLVNNKTVTQSAIASMGSLVNNGAYTGGNFSLTTTDGGITNGASMTGMGYVEIQNGGDFVNNGQFVSSGNLDVYGGGNVTNNGQATVNGDVDIYEGGNFTNAGTMSLTGNVYVVNGSITNSGKLGVDYGLQTASNTAAGKGYTAGADYSITNTGTITGANDLILSANTNAYWGDRSGTKNTSTGSVSNTGTLRLNAGDWLGLYAYNDVNLAGTVQAHNGTKYAALSAANSLNYLYIYAGEYGGGVLNTDGVATLATDIVTANGAEVYGNQVKLLSNLSSVDATGAPQSSIDIIAGAASATDYAVRVASGKTVTAGRIYVDGDQSGNESNVIVQGTLAADDIEFGSSNAVGDVFTGPTGSLVMSTSPYLYINSTGRVKTVPYNNASNFRFNGLTVNVTDGSQLFVDLDPSAYQTNGTSNGLSAVNLLVNSDVKLYGEITPAPVTAGGSAVTGVINTPNTHLVLQSSGNIEVTGPGADFYWPGYVYLGNVAADASGNALPGTLGLGTIKTDGAFNNVLPGDIAGASGIHFITQFPMTLGGDVVTNANAWVNFGTDLLTQAYATGTLGAGRFFGGTQGAGTVVNYGALDASMFHTHAPVATK